MDMDMAMAACSCLKRFRSTIFQTFCNLTANLTKPHNPIPQPSNLFRQLTASSPILRRPVLNEQRRFAEYYIYKSFFQNHPRLETLFIVIASGAVYFGNRQTVPYSKRKQFVVLPSFCDRWLGDFGQLLFLQMQDYAGRTLSDDHPDAVEVKSVFNNLIETLQTDLQGRQKKTMSRHLKGLNWQVLVLDEIYSIFRVPCSLANGTIVMSSRYRSEAEIAAVLGHEIGHVVGRHTSESFSWALAPLSWKLFSLAGETFLADLAYSCVLTYGFIGSLWHPFYRVHREHEIEADHIGMLLMASAGYDPRVALKVYREIDDRDENNDDKYPIIHPPGKKRARLLSQPDKMDEALALYESACDARHLRSSDHKGETCETRKKSSVSF